METYSVFVPSSIKTKYELFELYTSTIYLGYSGISNWDAFEEILLDRLEDSDITISVRDELPSNLPLMDQEIYEQVKQRAFAEFPDKISFQ